MLVFVFAVVVVVRLSSGGPLRAEVGGGVDGGVGRLLCGGVTSSGCSCRMGWLGPAAAGNPSPSSQQ